MTPRAQDPDSLVEVARLAARRGGAILRESFGRSDLDIEEKAQNDFVSRADRESETAVVATILETFPDHRVLAEESGSRPSGESEFQWIVDPLDGTTNFLRGVPYFCVSVACRRAGEMVAGVVLDPLRNDEFCASRGGGTWRNGRAVEPDLEAGLKGAFLATGFPFKAHPALQAYLGIFHDVFQQARGVRRCGAAALDLAYTAAGIYDGFFEFCLSPWDLAAGCLLIEEAGGVVSDLDGGDTYLDRGSVLAGTPSLHRELLEIVGRHADEAHLEALLRP